MEFTGSETDSPATSFDPSYNSKEAETFRGLLSVLPATKR